MPQAYLEAYNNSETSIVSLFQFCNSMFRIVILMQMY